MKVMANDRSSWIVQNRKEVNLMEWTLPKFEEVSLNCEINSYASAQL
jgi:coenzyme PQQ precursor peptide PqqA